MVGPRVRINKGGIYIAKPGRSVDDGAGYQFFAPGLLTQTVYMSGVATSFADYEDPTGPTAWRTYYKIATVNFTRSFVRPPLAYAGYFSSVDAGFGGWAMNIAELRQSGTTFGNYPRCFLQTSTTQLKIWANRNNINAVTYYIMENTLP